jgi:hypothetical protein
MLLAMRAVQGAGGAMIAPAALALITTTFPEGRPRNRAMGVYAAMSGSGAAMPMRIMAHRMRAGSYVTMLCLATAMVGIFFFMTLFLQEVLGYSPIQSGLAFLPFAGMIIVMSEIVSVIVARTGPRALMLAGGVLAAGGTSPAASGIRSPRPPRRATPGWRCRRRRW